ncbi:2-phospho-L-lactate guanylyltransferase [Pseudokineococcus sp. 1T1Z-3]|uniref:2-phospho-L-lactate guanylyltransferase n=1 Tax=Pseudokineococcus sp. 1T1Z-3 TaxID=3132745 RepID=UPI0030AF805D
MSAAPGPGRGTAAPTRWRVVLPVKGGPTAKSRLGGEAAARGELALAMAMDCLEAVLRTPGVERAVVVTGDAEVGRRAHGVGAVVVVPSSPVGHRTPLDAAVADGVRAAAGGQLDGAGTGVAVLLADLPALDPVELARALAEAAGALADGACAALLPDAEGSGTALLAAAGPEGLRTAYGAGSAERHEALGARRLAPVPDLPTVRRDVDTPADLQAARRLGLGRRTRALLGVGA